jgi:hypothetical protein
MTAKSSITNTGFLAVTWMEPDIKGYTDLLPVQRIAMPGVLIHDVRSPKGGIEHAKCYVTPGPNRADLDYSAYLAFNEKRGMDVGVLRLLFGDVDRTQVFGRLWKQAGSSKFTRAKCTVELLPPPDIDRYAGPKGSKTVKVQRLVTERSEQVRFRKELKSVYGNQCCISGCTVGQALDGAHIDPYRNAWSNRPQNGLLLRRDLHALFDAGLLAIHPKTRIIYFAPEAGDWGEYREWNRKRVLSVPAGGAVFAPSKEALLRRWKAFLKSYPV